MSNCVVGSGGSRLPRGLSQTLKEPILHHHIAPSATVAFTIGPSDALECRELIPLQMQFLDFAGHVPQIYQQTIHLCHPTRADSSRRS